jgi:cation diffusion facilitator CzcD-associated flavoprotein CzcO
VTQVHSASYRNPEALPVGPVLVVGGGNSGFQITEELAAPRRPVDRRAGHRCSPAAGRQGPVLVAHPARPTACHRRLAAGRRAGRRESSQNLQHIGDRPDQDGHGRCWGRKSSYCQRDLKRVTRSRQSE